MKNTVLIAAAALAAMAPESAGASGSDRQAKASASPFMRVYGPTSPPIGHVQFCERFAEDCIPDARGDARVELTPERLSELDAINRTINREIAPATDLEIYGVEEHWTYPDRRRKGDCEDYVILKRRVLMERGWPTSALLITVVRDERLEGHAILAVRTQQGDFVLDNKNDDIRPWHRTSYSYVMRQSYMDPRIWVSLERSEGDASVPVAGVRNRK
jgi:predicted transglutaminase-like cysteine proteinase